jgi:hypothetical protein
MYNIAANKAGMPTIKKLSEIPKERILPWMQPTSNNAATKFLEQEWLKPQTWNIDNTDLQDIDTNWQ